MHNRLFSKSLTHPNTFAKRTIFPSGRGIEAAGFILALWDVACIGGAFWLGMKVGDYISGSPSNKKSIKPVKLEPLKEELVQNRFRM